MKTFDLTKPVQTRDGRPVRILCTDAIRDTPVIGLVRGDTGIDQMCSWRADGTYLQAGIDAGDLINVPIKRRVTGWLNVYPDGAAYFNELREDADKEADATRIACIPIDIEYTEGDGLDGAQ